MRSVMTPVREEEEHYKHGEERLLRSYATVMGAYGAAAAGLTFAPGPRAPAPQP